MKIINLKKQSLLSLVLLCTTVLILASCNKALPDATPILYPDTNPAATTLGDEINSNPNYTFYKAALAKVGMTALLTDTGSVFTVFLPTNSAFIAAGITSVAMINGMPAATVGAIVQYTIIPGQQFLSGSFGQLPNIQLPTTMTIGALPGTPLPLKNSIFISKTSVGSWANNMPITAWDMKFRNGVIHTVGVIVSPPSATLKDLIATNNQLSYYRAAIARADSGTDLNSTASFNYLLGYGVTNMTVLAPNNAAFQTLIFGMAFQGYLNTRPLPRNAIDTATAMAYGNGAVAAGPAFLGTNNVKTSDIRGIMAYHFIATNAGAGYQPNVRMFSNNFGTTPTFYKTLVNSSVSVHPGIMAKATFTGPFVSNLTFTGMGTFPPGGAPFSGAAATAVSMDNGGVNGVYYVLDKVLLPQ
jgi:uncharacterized surface protein with fasciclin (FAS1) repeats